LANLFTRLALIGLQPARNIWSPPVSPLSRPDCGWWHSDSTRLDTVLFLLIQL